MSQEWYYAHGGVQKGPVTEAQLKALIPLGQLLLNDLVWRDGMAEWVKAGTVRELFPAKPALPPPPPPPTPKRPQSPTAATAAPVPNQSPQTTGSAAPTPIAPAQSSVDVQNLLQNPLVIVLSFLCCSPVGLVLVGIHPRISRKTKLIVFGCLAAFIVIAMIIEAIGSSVAYKQALEANALWEKGKHEEAVAIYKSLVAGESGGMLPDSMKPTVYGRLIDHDTSLGNVAGATKWIEQADKFKVVPDVRSEEAQRILSSLQEKRRQKEQLAQTKAKQEEEQVAAKKKAKELSGKKLAALRALIKAYQTYPKGDVSPNEMRKFMESLEKQQEQFISIPFDPQYNRQEAKEIAELYLDSVYGLYNGQHVSDLHDHIEPIWQAVYDDVRLPKRLRRQWEDELSR